MAKKRPNKSSSKSQGSGKSPDNLADDALAGEAQAADTDGRDELARRYGPDADGPDAGGPDAGGPDADSGATNDSAVAATERLDTERPYAESLDAESGQEDATAVGDLASADASVDADGESSKERRNDESPNDASSATAAPAVVVKSGRGLAFFSLLVGLAGLAGAGYLYYELVHLKPMDSVTTQLEQRIEQLRTGGQAQTDGRFEELSSRLASMQEEQGQSLQALAQTQSADLKSTQDELIASLNKVANTTPPSQQEWKLAEVEYLLRIANHRVLMEEDAKGALQLLSTADAILTELDDFGLHGVRAQLAEEILALKQAQGEDLQGIFLRLESLKGQLSKLPLQVPEFMQQQAQESVSEDPNVLESVASRFGTFLQFRRNQTPVKPLLAPDETLYLEMNLRLMLERAQLATLRTEQVVYEESLLSANQWMQDYLDPAAPEVAALRSEVESLAAYKLAQELPDISGSLRTLLATERGTR